MKKVKGYCAQCRAWRAFQLQEVYHEVQPVHMMGRISPVVVPGIQHCLGTCSKGHYGPFSIWEQLRAPRYQREYVKSPFGRGISASLAYTVHRESFRRYTLEGHYTRGHVCGFGCPEYAGEWDVEGWGLN